MKYLISILLIATSLMGKAEKYSFEKGLPAQIQVSENSQIELSPLYYKDGTKKFTVGLSATFLPDTRRPTYINAKKQKRITVSHYGFIMKRYKTTHLSLNS